MNPADPVRSAQSPTRKPEDPGAPAVRWILIPYAAFSALWIYASDSVVTSLFSNPRDIGVASTLKGLLFVAVTTALLAVLLRRYKAWLTRRDQEIERAHQERVRALLLLEAIAESSPDAVIAKDSEGRYLVFNKGAARMTGKRAEDVLGRTDKEIFPEAIYRQFIAGDAQVLETNAVTTMEETVADPRGPLTLLVTKGPLVSEAVGLKGIFGISRDITARKTMEERLRESELRFSTFFRRSPLGLAISAFDPGPFVEANDAFLRIIGFDRDEVIGHTALELRIWPDLQERAQLVLVLVEKGQVEHYRAKLRRKSGELRDVVIWGELIELGGQRYFMGIVSDVTGNGLASS